MKKKILFVIDSLHMGGAEKSLVSLLNALDKKYYDFDVMVFSDGGVLEKELPDWANLLPLPAYNQMSRKSIPEAFVFSLRNREIRSFFMRIIWSFYVRLKKGSVLKHYNFTKNCYSVLPDKYDIAISYLQGLSTYFVVDKVNALKKIAWIHTECREGGYDVCSDQSYYKKLNYVIAPSSTVRKILEESMPGLSNSLRVIPNILDVNDIIQKSGKIIVEDCFKQFEGIKIVTLGRLVKDKGYDLAIRAGSILAEMGLRFRWFIIGDGSEYNNLRHLSKELDVETYFSFLGTKDNPYPYINNCDIYVQTSRTESYCIAIEEAKVLRKPIVTTNFQVAHERIQNGVNGSIVSLDASAIAEEIIALARDKKRQELYMSELVNQENIYQQYVRHFLALL